jgi:hypothetical protein
MTEIQYTSHIWSSDHNIYERRERHAEKSTMYVVYPKVPEISK